MDECTSLAVAAKADVSPADPSFLERAETCLKINFEPIIDTRSGHLLACEALMRGADELGFDHPHTLLNAAHAQGDLFELELLLAKRAIAELVKRPAPRPRLFLNIDGRTLPEWDAYGTALMLCLDAHDLRPTDICLEISEAQQVLMGNALRTATEGLRSYGFRLAIDDFGTGVSGLEMLYHVRPNYLKIDRFFVEAMPKDAHKRLLVNAVTDLAHTLGARVIAEGVETEAELHACRMADCELIQGHLVKPPSEDLLSLEAEYNLPGRADCDVEDTAVVQAFLQTPPTVTQDMSTHDLFAIYASADPTAVLPVVDGHGHLLGGIHWQSLRKVFGSRYGDALAHNPHIQLSVRDFIAEIPCIDLRQPLAQAIDLVADGASDGVMAVERGRYVGYLSPHDLMKLANHVLTTEAQRHHPLTGLPGNEAILARVNDMGRAPTDHQMVCYLDIQAFTTINANYGFETGDRILCALSDLLRGFSNVTGAFVGHIGGDDFAVLYDGPDLEQAKASLALLPQAFAESSASLLPPRNGAHDRVSLTIAGQVFAPGTPMPTSPEISMALALLKGEARKLGQDMILRES